MNSLEPGLRVICEQFLAGTVTARDLINACLQLTSAGAAAARVDLDRQERCGFPEVIYGEGKPTESLLQIVATLVARGQPVLATRLSTAHQQALAADYPVAKVHPVGRTFRLPAVSPPATGDRGKVALITAGTSDLPIAAEAEETLLWMGIEPSLIFDVGVAGPHRLPAHLDQLAGSDAVVVIAGMEGALPSVVGGYVSCPVIAVPTSVGYGASFQGVAALLGMLNCCASNVAVVNIDAGFKGAYLAGIIASRAAAARRKSIS